MKFGFIAKYRGVWPLDWMCGALQVSRGGFYTWMTRPRSLHSQHSQQEEVLDGKVVASFTASDRTYGTLRVWHDLLALGLVCGLHRVERVMRGRALRARPRRRWLPADLGERLTGDIAANVLDRGFAAPAPNQKWIADFTYIWTAEGWLYVAAVIDLFSRRVVGWSMRAEMTALLVTYAVLMAIWRRSKPDALLHHSTAAALAAVVAVMDEPAAMGRPALIQSLFKSIDDECGMSGAADPPTDDAPGENIDDESDINEALPG